MEVVTGALPSVISKLGELLVGAYSLQKGLKGEIRFLQAELESMQGALEKISKIPADQVDNQEKIWARNVRELSYDIEDSIDTFMVRVKGSEPAGLHGIKKFIDRSAGLFGQAKIRHKIATEVRDIKSRVEEVSRRRDRYKINNDVTKLVTVDPRILAQYMNVTELVGIAEARDELIKILMEGYQLSMQEGKIVSIVGFGGLGKTTLANAVYEKLKAQFDCLAFVSVSQNPDIKNLFKDMLYQLTKKSKANINEERHLINELREFLQMKRYLVVVDDLWEISFWKIIRCALPDNNCGYRIITTTRIFDVAEQVGGAYKLKPLCLANSRILLFRRIFGKEDKDKPDEQLVEISDKILKKCAGVPLAIITIASLLASRGRNKMEWYEVYKSVGTGMENCLDVENMRNILSLSYYDLPSHLRTCLLYFSLFPEDYVIDNERLVWMWIAEGFIQSEKKRESLFELGESYFNELINRSMIQLVHKGCSDLIKYCRVHDMVLDLIHSLSSEENFVTILNDVHHTSPSKKVRRLSLQNGKVDHFAPQTTMSIQQVRSVVAFPFAINITPALQSFRILRVLDLQDSCLSESCNLNYLENLFHLRYLGLRNTHIAQLPEEIGNLRFLQTLDVKDNEITRLPSTVVQLRHLMCLRIEVCTRVPNGIGSLTSLEELSMLCIDDSTDIIEELGHLTQLRVLDISCQIEWNCILEKSLVKCLSKLQKIKSLYIWVHGECNLDDWITPQHLSRFGAAMGLPGCWFSTLPAWINSSLLLNLSFLSITVRELQQEDLEILGRLPALRDLHLEVDHRNIGILERFVFSSGSFPSLVHCGFSGYIGPFVFQEGAMPRIKSLRFTSHVREMREIADSFYLGLRNLPSLQLVAALFFSRGASKEVVEEAKAALRHEIEIHPNHPTLWIPS